MCLFIRPGTSSAWALYPPPRRPGPSAPSPVARVWTRKVQSASGNPCHSWVWALLSLVLSMGFFQDLGYFSSHAEAEHLQDPPQMAVVSEHLSPALPPVNPGCLGLPQLPAPNPQFRECFRPCRGSLPVPRPSTSGEGAGWNNCGAHLLDSVSQGPLLTPCLKDSILETRKKKPTEQSFPTPLSKILKST